MYRLPQMILFDYGQTLVDEGRFEPIRGNEALLNRAVNNPNHVTVDQIQELQMPRFVEVHHWKEIIAMVEILTDPEKLLFSMDNKDYPIDGKVFRRTAVRGLIRRSGAYAMIHSAKFGEYKFPGGGVETAEQLMDTLIREVKEETGLLVKPETIEYLGCVEERRQGLYDDIFSMDSYYCFCETEEKSAGRCLDDYEAEYGYELEFITLEAAIANNEQIIHKDGLPWIVRDTKVMKWLLEHGF